MVEKLKGQNEMLKLEMQSMVVEDEQVRSTLRRGEAGASEDYADRVQRIKRANLLKLSQSKHEMVEQRLHERYDIGGFERYRVLPSNVRPTEWPTPLRRSSKEKEGGTGKRGQSTE